MERRRRKEEKVKFPELEKKFEQLRRLEEEYIKLPQLKKTNEVRHLKKETFERPVLPDRTQELRRLEKENLQLQYLLLRLDKPRRLEKEQPLEDFIEKPTKTNSLPMIHRNQVGSSSSRGFMSPWQRTLDGTTAENTREPLEKMKRHRDRHELNKKWLKACLQDLKTKTTKESRRSVLQWLQKSRKSLNEKSYQAGPSISLGTWLVNSWITFEKEHPEEFMGDVANWLEISLKHMELRGPKTRALTPEEWLEASIQAIQNLLTTEAKLQSTLRWHGKII